MQNIIENSTFQQKTQTKNTKKFWLMLTVFYALFVIRNVFSVEFPISFYLIWVALMSFVFNNSEMKALLVSFIPLVPGFQSKYAILICMIFLLIKNWKRIKIPTFVFFIPLLMFWEFLHLNDSFSSVDEYLSSFAPLMILAIIVSLPKKNEDISFFTRPLAVSMLVGALIVIFNTVMGNDQSLISLIQEGFRLGTVEEIEGHQITYNENGLGYLCNLAIVGLFTNVYFNKAKKIDYFILPFLIFVGCLTISRTFLICLAVTIVFYVIFQEKSSAQKIKKIFSIAGIIFLCIVLIKLAAPNIIENYVERFNAEDITGGRAGLFEFYNEFITSSPLHFWFGIGAQAISEKVKYMLGIEVNVPHNGYQQMLVAWGVVGFFIMTLFIVCLVRNARKRNPNVSFISYLPLVLLLVNIMAGQFITAGTRLMSLIFIYLMICNGGKETVKDRKYSE